MAATSGEHFSLRWNNYSNHIANAFDSLRSQEDFVDVTLCCEGRKIRAHKVLLSACSWYFRDVFKENPCQHPVIVFKNVKYDDLLALIEFMYQGEVSVQQESLPSFLTTAEMLSVQGLTGGSSGGSGSTSGGGNNTSGSEQLPTIGSQTLTNPTTTTYVQALPQLVSPTAQQQTQKHQQSSSATKRTAQLVSTIGGDITNVGPMLKSYSVQAVVNKTQMSTAINIPATVKLRSIPATKQHQQQQQKQQSTIVQQQTVAIVESAPAKKRRISHVDSGMNTATNVDIEEAEFIVTESHEQQQQQQLRQEQEDQQQQLIDEVDTNDDEDIDEDDPNTEFVKMEMPEYMDEARQQQQNNVIAADEDMLDEDDEEEEEEDEDEQHLEQEHSAAGDQVVDEQYGIMEASDLELMYQQHQQEQQQTQQDEAQQQSGDIETLYISQSSMEETTTATTAIAKSEGMEMSGSTQQTSQGTTTYPRRANSSGAAGATSSADLVCKICVRKFTSHAALKRHIESKHTQNLVTFSCEVCNKPFKTKWSLSTHTSRFHRRSALEEVLIVDNEQEYNDDNADDGVVVMKSSPTGSPKQTPEKQLASMGRANVEIAS